MDTQNDLLTMLALDTNKETENEAIKALEMYDVLQDYLDIERPYLEQKPHVVIVGGGIISLMTAMYLNELGFNISIIEQKSFGAAASGRNGGAVMVMGRPLYEIPFTKLSMKLWESLSKKGIETNFLLSGHLMVARNSIETERIERAYELYRKSGVSVKLMDHDEMRQYTPDLGSHIKRGLFCFDDAQAYPFTTIQSLLKKLKTSGVQLYPYTKAIDFEKSDRAIKGVVTEKGVINGDYFLISSGPWSTPICELLDEKVEIRPRRSQLLVTEVFRNRVVDPFFTGNGLYSRQTHAGNLLFGGGGPWEVNGYNIQNTSYAMQLLSSRLVELFPSYRTKQVIRAFAGTVEITPDHLPAFGGLLNWDNGFISAGYCGHGFAISALMGKMMGSIIYDTTSGQLINQNLMNAINPMSIERFILSGQTVR